jgi:hypothetical protein
MKQQTPKFSVLIPALTVIPYCDLKKKTIKQLIILKQEMVKFMESNKSGIWAVASVNYFKIEYELNRREKARNVKQLSFVA